MVTVKLYVPDPDLCTGCRICEMVCSLSKEKECNPRSSRIRVIRKRHEGVDIPIVCQNCEYAPCISVCPTKAISKDLVSGIVTIHDSRCIGCGMCLVVCPFGAISMHAEKHIAVKCDLCNGSPLCVKFCPTKAIKFIEPDKAKIIKARSYADKFTEGIIKSRKTSQST